MENNNYSRPNLFSNRVDTINKKEFLHADALFNYRVLDLSSSFIKGCFSGLVIASLLTIIKPLKNKYLTSFIAGGIVSYMYINQRNSIIYKKYSEIWFKKFGKKDENINNLPKIFEPNGPYSQLE